MAVRVEFREFKPRNARNDLIRRLEAAPEQHVEAILSLYELLQKMHDKGVIDLANGLLSAGDTVVEKVADLADSIEVTKAMRLMFMMTNVIKVMDVQEVHNLLAVGQQKPASLLHLGRRAMSEDARIGMTVAVELLNVFGAALRRQQSVGVQETNALREIAERFFRDPFEDQKEKR